MPQIIIAVFVWLGQKIGFSAVKKGILISSFLVTWGIYLNFIYFSISIISKVNFYINDVFLLVNSSSSSSNCIFHNFIASLGCIGILPAINDILPIFLSSVASVFLTFSYKYLMFLRRVIDLYFFRLLNSV